MQLAERNHAPANGSAALRKLPFDDGLSFGVIPKANRIRAGSCFFSGARGFGGIHRNPDS
jgi:hypothetical protein